MDDATVSGVASGSVLTIPVGGTAALRRFGPAPLPYSRRANRTARPRWERHGASLGPVQREQLEDVLARLLDRYASTQRGDDDGGAAPMAMVAVSDQAPLQESGNGSGRGHATAVTLVADRDRGQVHVWFDPEVVPAAGVDQLLTGLRAGLGHDAGIPQVSVAIGSTRIFEPAEETTVLDAVLRHARHRREHAAVISGRRTLSYGELAGRAMVLGAQLRELGVTAESPVVLLLPPSVDFMVGALGAFSIGATFVPVDPEYPRRRVTELLAMVPGAVVVTTADLLGQVPDGSPVLDVGALRSDGAAGAAGPLRVHPDSAACTLFTSASTGSSKGVVLSHRGLGNLCHCAAERLALTTEDRFFQLASPSFSGFLEEAFPSLVAGGTLVLAGYRQGMPSVPRLLDNLERDAATIVGITTPHWHELTDYLTRTGRPVPESLRLVLMGSERAKTETVRRWRDLGVPLVHVYGPTEATATASYFHLGEESPGPDDVLPIGRVIPNTEMHLLDPELEPVPLGLPGEVYVGGVSLARGYLAAAGATADRFVPSPGGPPGARLYRTGDLARFLEDGNLEFLGREAGLIKVHGARVNPGEVETFVEMHPEVAQAVVTAAAAASTGQTHLVCHVAARGDLDLADLRAFLAERLPSFMVPARFVILQEGLPLNANGKTDRRALGTPPPAEQLPFDAPRSPAEASLAGIWSRVLDVEPVPASADFFDLGGDSLQVVRLATELTEELGIDLELSEIYRNSRLHELARLVESRMSTAAPTPGTRDDQLRRRRELVSETLHERTGLADAAPLSLTQQGLWFLTRVATDAPALYMSAVVCELKGELDIAILGDAVREVVTRHEPLRTAFVTSGGQPVQVLADVPDDVLTVIDPVGDSADERGLVAWEACQVITEEGVDIESGAPAKAVCFRLEPDRALFLLVAHHLVMDHWSERVFLRDLMAAYRHLADPAAPALPPLALSYQDYAVDQWTAMRGQEGRRLRDYWRRALAGLEPAPLPYDHARRPDHDFAGSTLFATLPAGVMSDVRRTASDAGTTPFAVLLAAFFAMLRGATGGEDLCVGTPFANRRLPGTEHLVGYFVNMIGLRVDVSGNPTFEEMLARTSAACIEAHDHEQMPFHLAVEEVRAHERVAGATPLFGAAFTLDRDPSEGLSGPGLEIGPVRDLPTTRVGLDLAFMAAPRGDELSLVVDYSRRLFEQSTVQSLLDDYAAVLRDATRDVGLRLSDVVPGSTSVGDGGR